MANPNPNPDRNRQKPQHNYLLPAQWHPVTSAPASSGTTSTTSGTSSNPRASQSGPPTNTQFRHYQPTPPQQQTTTTERYQITAPFQIPRMPHSWPYPAARREGGEGGVGAAEQGTVPIDPRLLGSREGASPGPAPPSGWKRSGPQSGWPPSSGGQ
ncbi:hypothetical protein BU26DRAFT_562194 [Trematosphaeria pertusa]|uniref:Uncharacterized protein n=1 Tax=Trematosphaeria pertusa TaxID=390896 RepID=A0A6A6IPJ8_9PLEO|nr:uncharacterized protein BU26DRAFT_562194 [Trematosphaeria pertusa]KAF2252455.1 hypothetical protein BU26DRAFT_562194 [Trematosphaeria pertusa]